MAMYIFADKMRTGKKIKAFNFGNMKRDFTYIDDIVDGIRSSLDNNYKNEIFNLGNNRFENLMDMIGYIEKELNQKAKIDFIDIQPGDVEETLANIDHSKIKLNYKPKVSIKVGALQDSLTGTNPIMTSLKHILIKLNNII